MTPRVTTPGEADLSPCQYVLERSWAGAESTPCIFTQPLMEIIREDDVDKISKNDDEQQNDSCPPYLRAPRTMQRVFASEPSEHQVRKLHICLSERAEISMILWISDSATGRRNRIFGY
ncbi:unnamed protein product [Leuciscus chuanchicus]